MSLRSVRGDNEHTPCVLIRGGCWSLDEKVGTTYTHKEVANTLNLSTVQKVIYEHEDKSIRRK